MFKKENRLVSGVRFNNSHIATNPQFILKEKKNELTVNRFGIIVSKKIDKRAVIRNRIKRFFRTTLMNLYGSMDVGHDILFIVKKEILNKTEEENMRSIEDVLGKVGVVKNEK